MKYKYLLFDIDGTILNFEAAEKAGLRKAYREFGCGELTDADIKTYSAINAGYWQKLENGEIEKSRLLTERFRDFFTLMGKPTDRLDEFNARYHQELSETIVFNDDAYELLIRLKQRYILAAVTNGTVNVQRRKLSKSGLDEVFGENVFISDLIGVEKPDKAFFDVVFRDLGIIDRSEALIIGDSLTSDIRGGINAGIDTCRYNPDGKPVKDGIQPTYDIRDLRDLEKAVLEA